jgi:hypothetical protein
MTEGLHDLLDPAIFDPRYGRRHPKSMILDELRVNDVNELVFDAWVQSHERE